MLVRTAYTPLAFVKVMTISLKKKKKKAGLCPLYMKTLPEVTVEKAIAVIEVCQQYDWEWLSEMKSKDNLESTYKQMLTEPTLHLQVQYYHVPQYLGNSLFSDVIWPLPDN